MVLEVSQSRKRSESSVDRPSIMWYGYGTDRLSAERKWGKHV